ncbi:hypothetical protein EON80_08605 [bacterium]|nr:MAG: hypothetical protein EON80_08605 [bacterium]
MYLLFWVFVIICPSLFFGGLFLLGWRTKSKPLSYLGGIPFAGVCALLLYFAGSGVWSSWVLSHPEKVYELEIGTPPPADITELQAEYDSFADWASVRMRFQTSMATAKKLAASQRLISTPRQKFDDYGSDSHLPKWWTPQVTDRVLIFTRETAGEGDFWTEKRFLIYDPQSRTAYYSFFGVS